MFLKTHSHTKTSTQGDSQNDTTPPKPSTGYHYKGNLPYAYWVGAKDIEIGHRLIDDKGNYQTVIAIHTKSTPLDSYNLEVDTDHTFFIKGIDGVDAVWVHNKDCWVDIPNNARKTQIGNDTVYEFDDNGRTVKVIENPKFSEEGGAKFFEVKVTGQGNKQKVAIIKQNKPDITRDINSNNTIVAQQGKKSNWNQYLNKPEPNKRIVIAETGHIYHTDSKSRVSLVEADLRKHQNDRNTNQQCKSGGCQRLPTDHGGHLIASMFDGLGEGINIVPMDAKLNGVKGRWYEMEKQWKDALENNGTVQVKIELIYSGDSKRPDKFIIQEKINGVLKIYDDFYNNPTGKKQ